MRMVVRVLLGFKGAGLGLFQTLFSQLILLPFQVVFVAKEAQLTRYVTVIVLSDAISNLFSNFPSALGFRARHGIKVFTWINNKCQVIA
jgi:hypothetical protein